MEYGISAPSPMPQKQVQQIFPLLLYSFQHLISLTSEIAAFTYIENNALQQIHVSLSETINNFQS